MQSIPNLGPVRVVMLPADWQTQCGACGETFDPIIDANPFEMIVAAEKPVCSECAAHWCPEMLAAVRARAMVWPANYFQLDDATKADARRDVESAGRYLPACWPKG
jgi:hypothetical protein